MTLNACSAHFSQIFRDLQLLQAVLFSPCLHWLLVYKAINEQVQPGKKGTRNWDPSSKEMVVEKMPTRERNALVFPVVCMAVGYRDRGLAVLAAMSPPIIAVGKKWGAMEIIRRKAEIIGIVQSF